MASFLKRCKVTKSFQNMLKNYVIKHVFNIYLVALKMYLGYCQFDMESGDYRLKAVCKTPKKEEPHLDGAAPSV